MVTAGLVNYRELNVCANAPFSKMAGWAPICQSAVQCAHVVTGLWAVRLPADTPPAKDSLFAHSDRHARSFVSSQSRTGLACADDNNPYLLRHG
jgi:hypothetical protein